MAAELIDGKSIARVVKAELRERVERIAEGGRPPTLAAVLACSDSHSSARVYAKNQAKSCEALGISYQLHELAGDASVEAIAGAIRGLNTDSGVDGIMVHMPLPAGVEPRDVRGLIDPLKDVEGVHPANIGNIVYGKSTLAPCTALAAMRLIESVHDDVRGKRAVVVGASDIVGLPVAVMLMKREATVVSCNKFTGEHTAELASTADILVAAAGVAGLVKAGWVKRGATVIDIGIHRVPVEPQLPDGTKMKTVGDVDPGVSDVAGHLTPVPGGVGPLTVAMLLHNVVLAAEMQMGRS